ncbi:Hypothetical predicted protein [Mytilus galloprovincialis]|uniref:Uncharacterized protein n=1 Tax=Mytilus galloprovincialis TaxID=29158 RepID=A0A8B6G3H5_MYTGA|nr:Hypothetical predicted protein [Mytilus galloprovincialis]
MKHTIFCSILLFLLATDLEVCQGCRRCPKGIKKVKCFVNPCVRQRCKGARCRPNYCGGCNRLWYTKDGSDVTKKCEFRCPGGSDCLPGVFPAPCIKDPCDGSSCKGHPNAICCSVFCGGCYDLWYVNGEKVMCEK